MVEKQSIHDLLRALSTKNFTQDEKTRLCVAISEEGSLSNRILEENIARTAEFLAYQGLRSSQKGGYQKGSKRHKVHCKELVFESLNPERRKVASKTEWGVYFSCVHDHMHKHHKILLDMFDNEIEIPPDLLQRGVEEISLKTLEIICHESSDLEIYRSDIEALYKVWPFARIDDFGKILDTVKDYEQIDELSDDLERHTKEFDQFKGEISSRVSRRREEFSEFTSKYWSNEEEAKLEMLDLQERTSDISLNLKTLNKAHDRIDKDIDQLAVSSQNHEKNAVQIRSDFVEFSKQSREAFKSLLNEVTKLEEDLSEFMESPTLLSGDLSQDGRTIKDIGWISKRLTKIEYEGEEKELTACSEDEFLESFYLISQSFGLRYPKEELEIYHKMVRPARVIRIADPDLLNCWVKALGWQRYRVNLSASPIWSDTNIWRPQQEELFGKRENPSIITILDFDKGLVETYLEPVLRLWTQHEINDPTKKLFLVNSQTADLAGTGSLETPILSLDRFDHPSLAVRELSGTPVPFSSGVSIESFLGWVPKKNIELPSNLALQLVSEYQIQPPRSIKMLIETVERSLNDYDEALVEELCFACIIQPWLQITQGEIFADDFEKKYEEEKGSKSS
jgi:hypothetical protein